jgi:hypothetical protein
MQLTVTQRVRSRREAQGRWVRRDVAVLVVSASQRLCVHAFLVPAEGEAEARLGASVFIRGF